MKLSTFAAALTFGLATAIPAPSPANTEYASVADNVISTLFERGILETRGCSKNAICSNHKCYKVQCYGFNTCDRYSVGGSC